MLDLATWIAMLIKCNQSGSPASIQSVIHGFIKSACQPDKPGPAQPAQPTRYHPAALTTPQFPTVKLFLSLGIAAVACSWYSEHSTLTSAFIAFRRTHVQPSAVILLQPYPSCLSNGYCSPRPDVHLNWI